MTKNKQILDTNYLYPAVGTQHYNIWMFGTTIPKKKEGEEEKPQATLVTRKALLTLTAVPQTNGAPQFLTATIVYPVTKEDGTTVHRHKTNLFQSDAATTEVYDEVDEWLSDTISHASYESVGVYYRTAYSIQSLEEGTPDIDKVEKVARTMLGNADLTYFLHDYIAAILNTQRSLNMNPQEEKNLLLALEHLFKLINKQ